MLPSMNSLPCFKAYDIRGRVPAELNEDIAYRIGRAFVETVKPANVVVGHDMRLSSPSLTDALCRGISDGGADVLDIGLCGTEQVYFSTFHLKAGGGIMVTASHNPADYNGMKLVREGSYPVSGDTGLRDIEALVSRNEFIIPAGNGKRIAANTLGAYIEHLLAYINVSGLKQLRAVVNAGNGCAGPVIDHLERHLPFEFIKVYHHPDGTFPNGIPNPLLPENRAATADIVRKERADVGIAWDGDFDRCFFFDENGDFIEGYYIVGLLASALLARNQGEKIIHDPRLTWNTVEMVKAAGGAPVQSKTGHAFIKERMRMENALYGGEMSAHHYFREFAYCDSGMIPWLLVLELMSRSGKPLSTLVKERMKRFPVSGEINRTVKDPDAIIEQVQRQYAGKERNTDETDGLSMEFDQWRFNLRKSNTEPVLRLNVETRGDTGLLREKTEEILGLMI